MSKHELDDPLSPELRRWFADHRAPAAPASLRRSLEDLPADHPATERLGPASATSWRGGTDGRAGATVRTVRLLAIAAALAILAVASGVLLSGATRPVVSSPTPSATVGQAETSPSATQGPTPSPSTPSGSLLPALPGFTTPAPVPAGATLTGLSWTKLAPNDPLGLVRQVLPWSGGYLPRRPPRRRGTARR